MLHERNTLAPVSMLTVSLLAGCASTSMPDDDPHELYREHLPTSVLVLPPINESMDVLAPYSWLTTVSEPLAELGYYVFPVAIVDAFMKDNGLPNPEDMHAAPLNKLGEIFGADAVLYVTLTEFGQKFELLSSTTRIESRGRLVDVATGHVLWQSEFEYADSGSHSSNNSLVGALLNAVVNQISGTLADRTHDAAIVANRLWFANPEKGLLKGPRHPGFSAQMAAALDAAETEAEATENAAGEANVTREDDSTGTGATAIVPDPDSDGSADDAGESNVVPQSVPEVMPPS